MNTKEVDKSIAKSDKYIDFQDSQLEKIYKDIKKTKTLDGIQESLIIAIEAIKRIYNYKTTEADIEKLNLFLNNVSNKHIKWRYFLRFFAIFNHNGLTKSTITCTIC